MSACGHPIIFFYKFSRDFVQQVWLVGHLGALGLGGGGWCLSNTGGT